MYESGNKNPSLKKLILLANFFDVTTDYLLGESDHPHDSDMLNDKLKNLQDKQDKLISLDEKFSSIKSQKEELIEHIQNIDDNLIKEYWELVNMLNLKDIAIIKDFKSRGLSLADAVKDLEKIVEKYK